MFSFDNVLIKNLWKCRRFPARRLLKELPKKNWRLVNNTAHLAHILMLADVTVDFRLLSMASSLYNDSDTLINTNLLQQCQRTLIFTF